MHFLYTIPKEPYVSVVILDNDKIKEAKEVNTNYKQMNIHRFEFCDDIATVEKMLKENKCPIYCLTAEGACVENLENDERIKKEIEQLLKVVIGN